MKILFYYLLSPLQLDNEYEFNRGDVGHFSAGVRTCPSVYCLSKRGMGLAPSAQCVLQTLFYALWGSLCGRD